jgi:polyhydroxybutyrate depolymerase
MSIEHYLYNNGDGNISVEHYKYVQGGHEWFNSSYQGQNTSELVWNFLSKYNINGLID